MAEPSVSVVDSGARKVSRQTVVAAPVRDVFAVVTDPRRHGEIDGSGTVQDTVTGPERLIPGATFSVRMKQYGMPYRITSTVTAFEADRMVEWRHPAGHRWRWEFAAATDDTTQVTETFDYTDLGLRGRLFEVLRIPRRNAAGIEKTLSRLRDRYSG